MKSSKTQTNISVNVTPEVKTDYCEKAAANNQTISEYFLASNGYQPARSRGRPPKYEKAIPRKLIGE